MMPDSNHEKPAFMASQTILGHPQFAVRKMHIFFIFSATECCHTYFMPCSNLCFVYLPPSLGREVG